MTIPDANQGIQRLLTIMAQLRSPDGGCPWDLAQTFQTIAPYTLEEAYEVTHAIELGNMDELRDELGDLLFQVVFHAQMAQEQGLFDFQDVVQSICDKMIRRHPHVFTETAEVSTAQVKDNWETLKAGERAAKGQGADSSVLAGVATALPAATRAVKLQKRAARVGFDWDDPARVIDKIEEELGEVRVEMADGPQERIEDEVGDLLFACTNLARHLQVDPERALRLANRKFEQRFRYIEKLATEQGKALQQCSLEELEVMWKLAKGGAQGS